MNDTRARFEEIWPVPEGVYWCADLGEYMRTDASNKFLLPVCVEYDARLDTFTRCQETMVPVFSLIEEMVRELDSCYCSLEGFGCGADYFIIDRANKLLEEMK